MSKNRYPKVTFGLIVYNEEKNITGLLENVYSLDYPKNKLDVIVVDDKSSDRTVQLAKQYPVRILVSGKKDPEISLKIALDNAKGNFFTILGADMRLRGKDWLKKMLKPLLENENVVQATTRYYQHPEESYMSRYLSLDPLQLDPIYRYFAPSIESTIVEKKDGYFLTKYSRGKVPPQNPGLYRTAITKKMHKGSNKWLDIDQLVKLVEEGYNSFAYVPDSGYYHFHTDGFFDLVRKRLRNLNNIYLPNAGERKYTWFDVKSASGVLKILIWIIIANLFFPLFIISIYKAIRNKTTLWLLDAPVGLILTDIFVLSMLKGKEGRKLILEGVKNIFG